MTTTTIIHKSNHDRRRVAGILAICCCVFLALCGTTSALGGGTNVIQKWVQYPDTSTNGLDVLATDTNILADDFLCTTNGPVTHITIWGSWCSNIVVSPCFSLGIWSDVPATNGFSHPGVLLWSADFPAYAESVYASNVFESFYDPNLGAVPTAIIGTDNQIWQYDFDFQPTNAFYQIAGNVYWLSVSASCVTGVTCTTNLGCCGPSTVYAVTNKFYWVTNVVYFETNTVCCGTNTISWGTNTFGWMTNTFSWGTNTIFLGTNTVTCVTNSAIFGWKTCPPADNWNDNGVFGHVSPWPTALQDWQILFRPIPIGTNSDLNLSFAIYTTQ